MNLTMPGFTQLPKPVIKLIHYPPQFFYAIGFGRLLGKFVLLLTTIGRSTGKPRVTPLQYEEIDGKIYLGSSFGKKADWVKNILKNPQVGVQFKATKFTGIATIIDDSAKIVEFLKIRIERHPKMIGWILRAEGLSIPPSLEELESYAKGMVIVVIEPASDDQKA
ncbi:MAG: nitroreductase family deazaflavin-dependent oxidoreductase [Anaerolineaceae bacterium]|nr:nitroreductase family deazaflavin-dependent oxidoreductase [Anaerolineaceae bacterium]